MRIKIGTRIAAAAILAAFVAASAPAQSAHREVGQKPEPGVESVVTIGSPLLKRYNMIVVPGVILERDVDVDLGMQGSIRISAGSPMKAETDTPKKLRVCTVAKDTYTNMMNQTGGACLTDRDRDGTFDSVSAQSVMGTTKLLKGPLPYKLSDVPENAGANNHQATLIYQGAAAGTLRLSYREFSNDMARPAFTEDLSFPITDAYPQTVTWRDTKITLLALSSDGLRYRIEVAK
ncbi:hypothetical protein [Sphingomonas sp.]|uniref:hypothetical protein n=1 Tax=Sphingomonas sp. TaxID=28214 RepID=UPI003B0040F3